MNRFLLLYCLFFFSCSSAQNFSGQWKGQFNDESTSSRTGIEETTEYVLELDIKKDEVTGYSYTYYIDNGKRYYTICKLHGFINRKEKYLEVEELERTKTNVPNTIRNCFQVHKLTYFKRGDEETLTGKWVPAPNQEGGCGFGMTSLTRRVLENTFRNYNNQSAKSNKALASKQNKNSTKTIAKNSLTNQKNTEKNKSDLLVNNAKKESDPSEIRSEQLAPAGVTAETTPEIAHPKYEKRNNNLMKTIEVTHGTIKVDLYDNGEVDGDSISLFYNSELLVSHKRLSEKPISLTITIDEDRDVNELIMYAENLGTIAPNTALMVVTDGTKRYEVRITSDFRKSGLINFVRR